MQYKQNSHGTTVSGVICKVYQKLESCHYLFLDMEFYMIKILYNRCKKVELNFPDVKKINVTESTFKKLQINRKWLFRSDRATHFGQMVPL